MSLPGPALPAAGRRAVRRTDLDGLRGVAIALVVVFHVWFGRVSGGVDVFLVLSGYFFTGLLVRRAEATAAVGLGQVLRRTARRLLPSMVVVLAAIVAATVVLRPYTQWSGIAAQTLAALFFQQNWQLALSWSDYLAADPSVSPLQHLWSMSVQGQFYVVAAVVVAVTAWVARRAGHPDLRRIVLPVIVVGAALVSFGYAVHGHTTAQGWNYYDSGARAWELLAGAGLALAGPYLRPARLVRIVLATAGIASVLLCGWVIPDGAARFPGPAALLPVCAAAALIVSAGNLPEAAWPVPNRLLAGHWARRLGDIAYPLYLWHWPILIFYLAQQARPHAGLVDGTAVIAVSVLLAVATHRWVEEPLRRPADRTVRAARRHRRPGEYALAAVALVVVSVAGAWQVSAVWVNPPQPVGILDPVRYPGAEALDAGVPVPDAPLRPTVSQASADLPPPTGDGCIADWDTRPVVSCTYGDPQATRTLAVVGSSHAEHWLPALQILAAEHGFRIQVYLKMGCPLTLADAVSYKGESNPDCRDWSRDVIDRLGTDRPDWVFTTGTRPRDAGGDETPEEYLQVWSALADRGLNVITIRDTPWLRRGGVRYKASDCLAAGGDRISCGMRRTDALDPIDPQEEPASRFPTVFPIDLTDAICDPDVCPVTAGNILVYHDEHHLSASYSRSLAEPLGRRLQPVLGWW
ncbi:acyltransferase family protein [Nocardia stercoris]|uniref:acyltransferase family protein n=1 Tax=Nocardia stercoris TaxID=2483361 RepID=UPI001F3F10CB|nr:acyltransferase family protein [Nocardia stercoris]